MLGFLEATAPTWSYIMVPPHPPDHGGSEQYDLHRHQVDNNLVLEGSRTFTLLNPDWDHPHHIIHLI